MEKVLKSAGRLPSLCCRRLLAPYHQYGDDMANVTRFNAFDDTLDDLFRGFFVRPVSYEGASGSAAPFRVDVTENENAYRLHAEIPGVKKEEIQITVDGDTVALRALLRQGLPRLHAGPVRGRDVHLGQVRRRRSGSDAAEEGGGAGEAHHDPVAPQSNRERGRLKSLPFFLALP
jgi:HSP20 family protein